jgi:NAD(P)-dependent dehydrogenase (short-subunit alcohol dehydrogenase family)
LHVQINPQECLFIHYPVCNMDDNFGFMKRLENKIAVIYGAGGIGGAIAKAFFAEGAEVFLASRSASKLAEIKQEIEFDGGTIGTSQLDVLDEQAVEEHLQQIIKLTGRIDISFNAIGIPMTGIQGVPLEDIAVDRFLEPVITYTRAHFITGQVAAKRMIAQCKGVIMMHTPNASRLNPPFVGGMSPAWAAMESLCQSQSVEWGRKGIRTVCLMTTGIPETPLIDEVWQIQGKSHGISQQQFHEIMEGMTHVGSLTTLNQLSAAAVFAASDEGSAISGTVLNLTGGMINS